MPLEKEESDEISLSESFSKKPKPILRNIVSRLQIASRLARNRRNSFEEENDVVADDHEIRQFNRQMSSVTPNRTRPKSISIRQLSKSSSKNIFLRAISRFSNASQEDEVDFEKGIISDGVIHFWKQFVTDEGHPFIKVGPEIKAEEIAKVMHQCWDLEVPKIATFVISNKSHSSNWTNQRQIKNFQKGLIDAAISTNMWIFTNGINSGAAHLIGTAIKNETFKMKIKKTLNKQKLTNLIGIIKEEDLRYGEMIGSNNQEHINLENEGLSYGPKFELNPEHTHFIIMKNSLSKNVNEGNLIMNLIEILVEDTPRSPLDKQTSQTNTLASTTDQIDSIDSSIETTRVPVVSILIDGSSSEAQLVLDLIKNHIPVVILRGSGGLADMIAFAYSEITNRSPDLNAWDTDFVEEYLKPMLSKKIIVYSNEMKDNSLARNILRDRIIECVRLCKIGGRTYMTVVNMHNSSSCNLQNLSEYLLLSILKSQQSKEMLLNDNFLKDLELTMDWNCADVAKTVIFTKKANNITKLTKTKFESALTRPNREEFVELFLSLGFQLHKYLSPSRLNRLFKLIHENDFYRSLCWESILGRSPNSKQPKFFIENDLNWLIEICTGLEKFVDTEHLHLNVMGLYPIDSLSAERKALTILTIWAVMHNRHKLAEVLWKHSDQPVHLGLVISMIFDRLSLYATDTNMKTELKNKSKKFADYANGVLDSCYSEDILRANNVLNESIFDWNYKTAVDLAANAQLKQFLAHPCCQKWLTNTFLGDIRLRELSWGIITIPPSVKILLCAFFIFPMYVWIRFKSEKELQEKKPNEEEFDDIYDEIYDYNKNDNMSSPIIEANEQTVTSVNIEMSETAQTISNNYNKLRQKSRVNVNSYMRNREVFVRKQPPLWLMIVKMWNSPITKFYTSQLFYIIFLPLLSLSVLYPKCGHWKLDLLVCVWTAILLFNYIRRTYILAKLYTTAPLFIKCTEILIIVVFVVLFTMNRVFDVHFYTPYTQKLILCVGVLYFYYRMIALYLPISPTLGPLLHRLKLMITVDFVNYMRIALVVIISNGIVMQAVLYPDTDINYETLRKAYHRAFFALFYGTVTEFEPNKSCDMYDIGENHNLDQCDITGRYNVTTCASTGFWPYAFVSQYFIFLKLILSTLLLAIFAATASKLQTETDNIWKFQRYLLVIDFSHRLPLPSPLSIIHYIYFIIKYFCKLCCKCSKNNGKPLTENDNETQQQYKLTNDECIYWRQLASNYIEEQESKAAKDQIVNKQWEYIQSISEDVEYEKKILREIRGKISELERALYSDQTSYKASSDLRVKSDVKSTLSRHSPYPGTRVIRVPLSDKYIPWEVMHIDYEPVAYSKPKQEYPSDMQLYIDEDIIFLKEIQMRNSMKVNFPNFKWNSNEMNGAGLAINRMCWHMNEDGSPLYYKLEDNYIPRNPFGRTGLRGRGDFPRWGPNHYVIFVITRWKRETSSPTGNKTLEFVIEQNERSGQNLLPERFVSGDDLFGELRNLFKTDKNEVWVLPEVVNYFKRSCISPTDDDFSFKLIINGYIDDQLNTDNAWKEAKVWHIHYGCREYLKKRFSDQKLNWIPSGDNLFTTSPLSHTNIIKSVVESLQAKID